VRNLSIWVLALILPVLAAAASMFLGGCARPRPEVPPTYVYVIDWSGSTAAVRRKQVGLMVQELESVPENAEVVIYRMGSETQEVFSGPLGDEGVDALVHTLKKDLLVTDAVEGTNFCKMAEALSGFSRRFKGTNYKLWIMTDGGNDATDAASMRRLRREAEIITGDKRLSSITFYGVLPKYRRSIRQLFERRKLIRFGD